MAKKKSVNLALNIVVIALCVLTLCSLFMPIFGIRGVGALMEGLSENATGLDLLESFFNGHMEGFLQVFLAISYLAVLCLATAVLVFAILALVGMNFKLVNMILGICLVVFALATLICAFIYAGDMTDVKKVGEAEMGVRCIVHIAGWLLVPTMLAGVAHVYNTRG